MTVARAVISSVPSTAGPIPPTPAGSTFGGIGPLVRKDQLMIEAPLAITVNRTNPSGMITSTNASTISDGRDAVAGAPPAGRLSQVELLLGGDGHQAPRFRRAERSTTPRAMTLMMIVKTNKSTPIPISAARNSPEASPNWFAMTAGMV